jgi:hypothetical protein
MIRGKIMKNEHHENGVLRGPLILTQPASNFVAVMSFDWFNGTNQTAVSAQTRGSNYLATRPRTPRDFGELSRVAFAGGVLNEAWRWMT